MDNLWLVNATEGVPKNGFLRKTSASLGDQVKWQTEEFFSWKP